MATFLRHSRINAKKLNVAQSVWVGHKWWPTTTRLLIIYTFPYQPFAKIENKTLEFLSLFPFLLLFSYVSFIWYLFKFFSFLSSMSILFLPTVLILCNSFCFLIFSWSFSFYFIFFSLFVKFSTFLLFLFLLFHLILHSHSYLFSLSSRNEILDYFEWKLK